MYDFMLPSDVNYHKKDFLSNANFHLGDFMWRILGVEGNITEETRNIFRGNRHTLYLNDKNLKIKFEEYLDVDLIPEMYKTVKSYYKEHKNFKEKHSVEHDDFLKNNPLDEEHVRKIRKMFSIEANPGLAEESVLKLLPQAYFLVLEWDTLKDQGLIYAERLKANNVPVQVAYYENAYHGMVPFIDSVTGYSLSRKMVDDLVKYIQENI